MVEDDPIQSESLRAILEYCGYTCEIAVSGATALNCMHRREPNVIVIDLGLPDCDGLDLISTVRSRSQVPIIVVSGRCAESDKIAALDVGADDYVQKPFNPGELVSRVRAKLRLRPGSLDAPDPAENEPSAELTRLERVLLSVLVKHQGATVSEGELIAAVWGRGGRATEVDLRCLVSKVRRKLELQNQPLSILSERGVGYHVSGWLRFSHQRSKATTELAAQNRKAMKAEQPGPAAASAEMQPLLEAGGRL